MQISDCLEGTIVEGTLNTAIFPRNGVRLVVRPENICLSHETGYAATIIQSQYLGYATSYLVNAIGLNLHVMELRRRGTSPYKEGERVFISWEWTEALIFFNLSE